MGLLGAGLEALGTGWLGLLGAAELLLEEALMDRLGSGETGLLGAGLEVLGTGWMGLLGTGWMLLLGAASELDGAAPGAGRSDTAAGAAAGSRLDRIAPAGGGSLMSASQASSTESGGASSAPSSAPGGALDKDGNARGVGESVVTAGSWRVRELLAPARLAARVSSDAGGADAALASREAAAGAAPADGALAGPIAITPINVEPPPGRVPPASSCEANAALLDAPGGAGSAGGAVAVSRAFGAHAADAESGSLAAEPASAWAAPKPRMVALGVPPPAASGSGVRPTTGVFVAAASSPPRVSAGRRAGTVGVVGAGGGRDVRSPDIEGSTRRGVFGPALARFCSGGGVLAERNDGAAGGGRESRRPGVSAPSPLAGCGACAPVGAVVAAATRSSSAVERASGSLPRGEAVLAARAAALASAFVSREPPCAADGAGSGSAASRGADAPSTFTLAGTATAARATGVGAATPTGTGAPGTGLALATGPLAASSLRARAGLGTVGDVGPPCAGGFELGAERGSGDLARPGLPPGRAVVALREV